ncbi:hypothetical protein [Streptomyces sp. JB150]|uniref:hypothetical protein n=1 Tax=Streptomyces sp. JB150 TaxID=2714844 RepID=UPI0014086C75|nr:hypothetical protein [Streptomyces sp. JB150]QIJ62807.1 hypothetical protein G7Z13_12750 [Streptomyces sp. JB150]
MWIFGRRRKRAAKDAPAAAPRPQLAFEITMDELRAIERVTLHARAQLRALSGGSAATIADASGSPLVPALHERAGAAHALGRPGIPMLVSEIGHVEAAVLNLESYAGHEAVLAEGYTLLKRLAFLTGQARVGQEIGGVVTLPGEAAGDVAGEAAGRPSLRVSPMPAPPPPGGTPSSDRSTED